MTDDFKERLRRYQEGELSKEEEDEMEQDLDKFDVYQSFLEEQSEEKEEPFINSQEVIRKGWFYQRFSLIATVLTVLLLIIPVLELGSKMYYVGKAGKLVDLTTKTIYLTEPNVTIDDDRLDVRARFFNLTFSLDLYKQIGGEKVRIGDWDVLYELDKVDYPDYPDREYVIGDPPLDIPHPEEKKLYHPDDPAPNSDWERLEALPDGTVAEVYVSFDQLYEEGEVLNLLGSMRSEWQWFAVNTGLEASGKSTEGGYLTPIGYPTDSNERVWSPREGIDDNGSSNKEQFLRVMRELEQYEEQATDIARTKWLDLKERNDYLDKNGVTIYGGVVTGPVEELLSLRDKKEIQHMKVGEVRLWNYD
ncbi:MULTISPECIES: anti-sigma factor [Pontibacillus]|uniref:Anti sigma factor C-terminal domain-containing protein n=1 Tax=Pontibacillus chungwhensis TaxID=265426 RepID=A0ABY8V0L4_9BACI|nr:MULTISPECIES: anti-sigma factor [Pontibacillus]MCD5325406.1 anti-sigma factor [Pontibacillus sp. HN14]WIF98521.1 anti sigma factor C-terminal domain-containing protein [Pontibacillus chungwhensis]